MLVFHARQRVRMDACFDADLGLGLAGRVDGVPKQLQELVYPRVGQTFSRNGSPRMVREIDPARSQVNGILLTPDSKKPPTSNRMLGVF